MCAKLLLGRLRNSAAKSAFVDGNDAAQPFQGWPRVSIAKLLKGLAVTWHYATVGHITVFTIELKYCDDTLKRG